jgi:hypothetical protein
MTQSTWARALAVMGLSLALAQAGCAASSDQPTPDENEDLDLTTGKQSYRPHGYRHAKFGCVNRVKVRTEPDRDFAQGESRRKVYGDVVDSQCATVGARIRVVDGDTGKSTLIQGNCGEGFGMTVRGTRLAMVVFADASACEAYAKVRSAAPETTTTVLRLVALQPIATFAMVSADANVGPSLGVEDVP